MTRRRLCGMVMAIWGKWQVSSYAVCCGLSALEEDSRVSVTPRCSDGTRPVEGNQDPQAPFFELRFADLLITVQCPPYQLAGAGMTISGTLSVLAQSLTGSESDMAVPSWAARGHGRGWKAKGYWSAGSSRKQGSVWHGGFTLRKSR